MRRLDNITDLMDMNLSSSRREWKTKEPGALQSMRLQRVRHNLVTKLQQHNSSKFLLYEHRMLLNRCIA